MHVQDARSYNVCPAVSPRGRFPTHDCAKERTQVTPSTDSTTRSWTNARSIISGQYFVTLGTLGTSGRIRKTGNNCENMGIRWKLRQTRKKQRSLVKLGKPSPLWSDTNYSDSKYSDAILSRFHIVRYPNSADPPGVERVGGK